MPLRFDLSGEHTEMAMQPTSTNAGPAGAQRHGLRTAAAIGLIGLLGAALSTGCGRGASAEAADGRVLRLAATDRVDTLDPVLAADLASSLLVSHVYDTLLQYNYAARPYRLEPSMLARMPEVSPDQKEYRFFLRNDLRFADDPCFPDGLGRDVTSRDVIFSLQRLADARNLSPGWWLLRGKIVGLDEFRERCAAAAPGDLSVYDTPVPGMVAPDDQTLILRLTRPDPRLNYALAMPYTAVVPREAVAGHGAKFAEHPVGSGPFRLVEWRRDYRLILERNPSYRHETWADATAPADRDRPLPYLDRIELSFVREPLAAWLLFLQGELDYNALDKDNFDAVVAPDRGLVPSLGKRGVRLLQMPEFQVNYIGFSFSDPRLARNLPLRRAIGQAMDIDKRIQHSGYRLTPAHGPIPPGVAGYDPDFRNPWQRHDVAAARAHLAEAGFPGGVDPATGKPLELTFDLANTDATSRQIAELMVEDMRQIGIRIQPMLNHKTRFFQKLRQGQVQLFRLSWVGDYPDGENFLQLFYGPNAGSCNRAGFQDPEYDRMYEAVAILPDSAERTAAYRRTATWLADRSPWIFESIPVSYLLLHEWVDNFLPHDFPYARWKYLDVDPVRREARQQSFSPLSLRELRGDRP
jgi:ABC-type transport system substrate-binding protein